MSIEITTLKVNDDFNKQSKNNPKLNQDILVKLLKITKLNLEMKLLLTEIGKECYDYLTLIDILLDIFPFFTLQLVCFFFLLTFPTEFRTLVLVTS